VQKGILQREIFFAVTEILGYPTVFNSYFIMYVSGYVCALTHIRLYGRITEVHKHFYFVYKFDEKVHRFAKILLAGFLK
jgi:hypothetical protein